MVRVVFLDDFKNTFYSLKDNLLKQKIIKQIEKIKNNPKVGKPMMHNRKETRELYIKPFRLSYTYHISRDTIEILELYHKKKQ